MSKGGGTGLLHLSWEDVQRLAEVVAERVRASGFTPDVVVAISRGGFSPARILCDQLSIQRLASLQIEYYTDVNQRRSDPQIVIPLNTDVPGLRAVVVDDVSDSGDTLRAATDHVLDRGASEVRVAALHVKPWSSFRPDYYAEEVDAWVVYPWETRETMMSMEAKLRGEGLGPNEVRHRLIEMGFSPDMVRKLL